MNKEISQRIIKEEIYGFKFEYLEGYRPTEEQILWLEIIAYEDSEGIPFCDIDT